MHIQLYVLERKHRYSLYSVIFVCVSYMNVFIAHLLIDLTVGKCTCLCMCINSFTLGIAISCTAVDIKDSINHMY